MINSSDDQHMLVMYGEACMEENTTMTAEGFKNFVAWRKKVEKYFDNNKETARQSLYCVV